MKFEPTDIQLAVQKLARNFAARELAPTVAERYEKCEYDRALHTKWGGMGIAGIPYPEEYGGPGADTISYVLAVEEISKVDAGMGISLSVHTSLCSWPIYHYGTEEQKQKYLVPLAQGVHLGSFGLTEPNAGTDIGGIQTTALDGGDYYLLNGAKIFNTNGGESDTYVVLAMTNKSRGVQGLSAFIVEKGWEGFSFGKIEQTLGVNSARVRELIFQNVRIPKANLLGKEGEGHKIAMATLDGGRIGVAAQAVGIAAGALEQAVIYAKARTQFGKPLTENQGLRFMLADMTTQVEYARLLVHKAAFVKDTCTRWSVEAAMAKLIASEVAMKVTVNALQIFGGYGYTREYPIERMLRDAKATQIYEGTSQVQQMVIAHNLISR
ncbi:MAG: acyl-CoA dehydrogenase family protein [Desulfarculales bacterium]|jgi:alkylation response protein AidB-like acyl-CoA dehydrogenase|nr:acyl-CoA dehydrogenase family protein [Desulfarculales bacterium]